jgi:putative transposase
MKKSKFSEEQIAYALRQAECGTAISDVCRQLVISEATFYLWRKKFAHLGVSELRRLRSLEEENARLKRVVAYLTLDKHMLAEALRKRCDADTTAGAGAVVRHHVRDQRPAHVSARRAQPDGVVPARAGSG